MKYLPALLSIVAFPVMAASNFTADALVKALIYLVILGLIFYAVFWFIGWIKVPEPINKILLGITGLVCLVILVRFLLQFI